jgi:hypothetical protein
MGECAEGYEGPLCSNCKLDYYMKHASHLCNECPEEMVSQAQVMFIGVCTVFMFSFCIVLMANVNWAFAATSTPN